MIQPAVLRMTQGLFNCAHALTDTALFSVLSPATAEKAFLFAFGFRRGGKSVVSDDKRERALAMLLEKHSQLRRLPKRSDFSPEDFCFIKQKLGPFPRALEAAGLKPVTKPSAALLSRRKRQRAALRRKQAKQLSIGSSVPKNIKQEEE